MQSAKLNWSSMMTATFLAGSADPKLKLMLCYMEGLTEKTT